MARWGEGDPRWLVKCREDGSNVNKWHWEEINKLPWAKSKLTELLIGYEHQNGTCKITNLKDISGDACIYQRKGNKKIATFDLTLTLLWEGYVDNDYVKGELKIYEFACANEPDEYEFTVNCESKSELKIKAENLWKSEKSRILSKLEEFTLQFQNSC